MLISYPSLHCLGKCVTWEVLGDVRCRQDISLVSNPPIGTTFGLRSIHSHYGPRMQPLECFFCSDFQKPIFQKWSELRRSYTIKQSKFRRSQRCYSHIHTYSERRDMEVAVL